ncbi:hypothetical protein LINPERHAP1_LOCUS35327, partial [Linum perenne]
PTLALLLVRFYSREFSALGFRKSEISSSLRDILSADQTILCRNSLHHLRASLKIADSMDFLLLLYLALGTPHLARLQSSWIYKAYKPYSAQAVVTLPYS